MIPQTGAEMTARWQASPALRRHLIRARYRRLTERRIILARRWW